MTTRTRRETVNFLHPFSMKGVDRLLPAGAYEIITDEETIEGLSFAAFRRVATMIMVLAAAEDNARELRDRQRALENELLSSPASSWQEAAAKARYVLNLYAAGLAAEDSHHRDLVAAVLADFARLSDESA